MTPLSRKNIEALSVEEIRQVLYELQVHQVELEMQNDELQTKQAELDSARARYFDLYDLAPVGYCTLSEKGMILETNLTATALLGLNRNELLRQPLTRYILPDDQDIYYQHRKQLFATGEPQSCDLRMLKKDETQFWAHLTATVAQDIDSAPVYRVVITDITERKRAENALRYNQAMLARTESIANVGSWEWDVATDTVTWSDELFRIFQRNPADGAPSFAEHPELYCPEDIQRLRDAAEAAISIGTPYEMELRAIRKDGAIRVCLARGHVEMGPGKRAMRLFGSLQDITDLRRAEQDYRLLFREMLDGFALHEIICNETGNPANYRFLAVNPAFERMTGLKAEDIAGNTVLEVLPGTERHWIETYGKVAMTGEPAFFESYSSDLKKYFQVTAFQPAPKQFACIFVDITERKRTEAEKAKLEAHLQQAQRMESIGSLAGGIAHDLNNILFPISGLSEMLLDEIQPENPAHEIIEQIHKSAQRGSDLVKQILSFSRQGNSQKLPIRIQPVLKEALKLAQATIPRNIEIKSHINTDCGMVSADPTQIHQIAINLITNAFHAVEQTGGMIDIALKEIVISSFGEKDELTSHAMPGDILAGRYACITISDTGTGIDQTLIDKIFDPYFTTKELGKGTGLGLSVVHGIIKEHGGDIRVYSEVGKGTAFHVYLPLLEDAKDRKDTAVARKYPTGIESILLVDDEEPILRMEQKMLERLGYQVTIRLSSPDALAAFKANPGNFDLVISDRGMPNMTGEQLAVELISIRPGIPIIICTGFSDENDVKRAKAMGVKGFLMKPVAIGDLATMVRRVLDEVAGGVMVNGSGQADAITL